MEANDFYMKALGPNFPDAMNFQLTASDPDPGRTFSVEGVDNIGDQIRDFIMARIGGTFKRTGRAPKRLFAQVKLTLDGEAYSEKELDIGLPWSNWVDGSSEGLTTIDGSLRRNAHARRN